MKKLTILEMHRLTPQEFKSAAKVPIVVVLDSVRSLHNVGAVFRTSDAFTIEAVYLCGITATPPSAEIHKTALGAEDSVEWHYYKDTMDAVAQLKEAGYRVFSVEQAHGSIPLQEFKIDRSCKYAVILGNEVKGVQQKVVDASENCIEIPQFGTKHSLNVSVTAGIIIWQLAKQYLLQ